MPERCCVGNGAAMIRTAAGVALIAAFVSTALPAAAGPGIAFLPQAPGQRLAYHLARTVETADGLQTTASDFTLVRRAGTTFVIERTGADGAPNLSVLKGAPDGTLAPSADTPGAAADADLNDLLFAVNLAVIATHQGDPTGSGGWDADVPVTPAPRSTIVPILMQPGRLAGTEFDFGGIGQATLGAGKITVNVRVDGHFAGGRVRRIAFVQARSIVIDGTPYLNTGTWSMTVGDPPVR